MNFAVFEQLEMNTTTIELLSPEPSKELIPYYQVFSVFNGAPSGTGREEAIQHLSMAGYHLQPGQEIAGEAEWPDEVRRQVGSRQFDRKLRRSWQSPCAYSVLRPLPRRTFQATLPSLVPARTK
jgi:hypothetical protein